ncbi:nitronate monooxygenase [Sulfurospirillum cavolei]|uniref:nitronate monooxygenase n=1 Tax=Sulfurospirillum cavolei TaxID=366522 RepID=UPI0007649301|nr:nitronate monooxygenase family protein [Sulfurospirillum cavolei]
MAFQPLTIGKYTLQYPIVQGGMGLGISWDKLAGSVSAEGGLGVISSIGTGYYENTAYTKKTINARPFDTENFYSKEGLSAIIRNARKICGEKALAVNILYAINDYDRVVKDACEAGANMIITGAGLPTNLPEFTADYPDVALIPIVSSAKALKIICKRWTQRYNRLPDAIIVEGPLSGGHQGFTYEQCAMEEYQLENLIAPILEEIKAWGDFPLIAAGGIWDHDDIQKMMDLGASGVQMGTRFIGTHECDADLVFKEMLVDARQEDIQLFKSPVGYPARGIRSNLIQMVEKREGPAIRCVSNCVSPCHRGQEAKAVGYCIADRLFDAYAGKKETGLFFTGANGYKLHEIISVKELMAKLVYGETH